MKRLTVNKPVGEMNMVELAHNCCYVKNQNARYRDYETDVDVRNLARKLLKDYAGGDDAFTCDEDFDEKMEQGMAEGLDTIEGLIAVFYRNIWAMAELRERLAKFEELEKLPEQICDNYCRYPFECGEGELEKKCQSCLIEKLADLLE